MVLALLADIHSNLEALNACLAHARSRGADRFAFIGDLVGYGADPAAVVDIIAEMADRGALVVQGNHDEAVEQTTSYLNETAAAAIVWTRPELSSEQRRFLAELPLLLREGQTCLVHASAAAPSHWDYVDSPAAARKSAEAAGTPYTFSGHVHDQVLYVATVGDRMTAFHPQPGVAIPIRPHHRWLGIVGSVGQPRDGNPAAAYAIADLERGAIVFHRVPYDNVSAARKVRAAGLPEALAYRLERGI